LNSEETVSYGFLHIFAISLRIASNRLCKPQRVTGTARDQIDFIHPHRFAALVWAPDDSRGSYDTLALPDTVCVTLGLRKKNGSLNLAKPT